MTLNGVMRLKYFLTVLNLLLLSFAGIDKHKEWEDLELLLSNSFLVKRLGGNFVIQFVQAAVRYVTKLSNQKYITPKSRCCIIIIYLVTYNNGISR